jgi:tRNA threonylcarbamoyl adenosine modification protein (Sua5/YciO/YrdC/YwlC family)
MLLPINPLHPEPRKVRRAVDFIENGSVIGYPTDTAYGLGCDLMNKHAIERLRQVKGVNAKKHLAFICPDLSDIAKYAVVDNATYRVLKHFLPGPYCFVLQATREVPKMVQSKQKTVGIRVPDHPVTQALVRELGRPVISTTAKMQGEDEPLTDPWEIAESFPGLDLVLGVDACGSEPATVVDLSNGYVKILRQGAGPVDDLL